MVKKLVLALLPVLLSGACKSSSPAPAGQSSTPPPALAGEQPSPAAATPNINEKVKETKTIKGIFRGFEGEPTLRQAQIELAEDDSQDDFPLSNDEALLYFLAANLDKPLEFTYQALERNGSKIDRLTAAKAGQLTHDAWWQQEKTANPDLAALRKKYDALVEQATFTEEEK
jgi:hypothetical protein